MATITTAFTYDCTTVTNFKQAPQAFASALLSLGWLTTGDFGALSSTNDFGHATITNVSASAGVVTVTYSAPTNNLAISSKILLTGLTTNTVLNNTYQVITTLPSTTTFTFNFAGTITNGADTGTATMTYGFATLTAPPDQTVTAAGAFSANFATGGMVRFRGAYVASTGTFTNLQVTNNLTTITVATPHGLDQTRAIGQALHISGVVNGSFTYLNTNPGSATTGTFGWPITAITQLTITVNTGSSPQTDVASTAVSAGVGNPEYQINNTASQNPSFDTATYQGDMYGVTSNSGLQNISTVPGTSNQATFPKWVRHAFDMFTTNDTLSSTNKLYFKILYGSNNTTASGTATPAWIFTIGAATDGAGNITTNNNWPLAAGSFPFSPHSGASVNTQTSVWETNISGTAGRLSMIMWRGFTAAGTFTNAPTTIFVLDRSKDNSGNDTDAYWTILWSGRSNSSSGGDYQQSVAKAGTGGPGIVDALGSSATTLSSIRTVNIIGGQQGFNNQLPFSPVFPVLGFIGNPLLGTIAMKNGDTSEGALVNATLYGTSHPYLMTIRGGAQTWGPNGNNAAGIRWE